MPAKIDIDARASMLSKGLQNQEQVRLNIAKKLNTTIVSTQDLPVLKRKSVLRFAHF